VVDAIQDSEAVILATPYDATGPLLRENAIALAGKIVIDATNPLKPDLSGLSLTGDVSGAELLQREAPSALLFRRLIPQATQSGRRPIGRSSRPMI